MLQLMWLNGKKKCLWEKNLKSAIRTQYAKHKYYYKQNVKLFPP